MHRVPFYGMCVSRRSVALQFAKLCLPKPLPLLLGTGRTPRPKTRLRVPTQSAHPTQYPHHRPTTLISCPPVDTRLDGREKLGREAWKSNCLPRRTRRTRRLPRNIGGPTRMVCGYKHFDLVVCFMSFSCKMRAFPCILPILCVAEEDEIVFDGVQPWHMDWYVGLDEQQRHRLQPQAQRKEEGEEAQEEMKTKDEDPWNLAWPEEQPQPQPQPQPQVEEKGEGGWHSEWEKEIEIVLTADLRQKTPTPPGTPKHPPQPRDEAERGMHRYAPLHHGTCYMVPFVTMCGRKKGQTRTTPKNTQLTKKKTNKQVTPPRRYLARLVAHPPPSTGQKWKIFAKHFFDIVTMYNDEIYYGSMF